jgi:pimeloyl-ACP methyl ester carboxylesterase
MDTDTELDQRLQAAQAGRQNRMSGNGDTDGTTSPDALAQLLEGVPVTERRLDLAGVSTQSLEGGDGPPIVLLHGLGGWGGVGSGHSASRGGR